MGADGTGDTFCFKRKGRYLEHYFTCQEETIINKQSGMDKQPKNSEALRAFGYFSQIGVTMAASVLVGVLLGKYLDEMCGTSPWLLLIFSLLGVGAAMKALFNMPKESNKSEHRKDK